MSESFIVVNLSNNIQPDDMHSPASVQLALGAHGSDGKNLYYLTQQLASIEEIDEAFDRLATHLESDRKQAKRVLKGKNRTY